MPSGKSCSSPLLALFISAAESLDSRKSAINSWKHNIAVLATKFQNTNCHNWSCVFRVNLFVGRVTPHRQLIRSSLLYDQVKNNNKILTVCADTKLATWGRMLTPKYPPTSVDTLFCPHKFCRFMYSKRWAWDIRFTCPLVTNLVTWADSKSVYSLKTCVQQSSLNRQQQFPDKKPKISCNEKYYVLLKI